MSVCADYIIRIPGVVLLLLLAFVSAHSPFTMLAFYIWHSFCSAFIPFARIDWWPATHSCVQYCSV